MNKQIKFRAWDNKSQQMLFQNQQYGLEPQYKIQDDCWTRFWEALYRCQEQFILMQFTGLLDKNGKEIYEGDIVLLNHWKSSDLFNYKLPFIVEYYEGEINFKQKEYNNFKGSLVGKIDIKIIGNIYENPELL